MTVAELIAKLQTLDPATEVVLSDDQGYRFGLSLHFGVMGLDGGNEMEDDPDGRDPAAFYQIVHRFPAVVVKGVGDVMFSERWKEV